MRVSSFVPGWYLLYTRPKHEKKVAHLLTLKNIYVFLPTHGTIRQWNDRKKFIREPLFPSYTFVYINNMKEYFTGQDIDGVVGYVKFGNTPARVDETVVNSIKIITESNADLAIYYNQFDKGQTLIIQEGPLKGVSCEMIEHKGREKALVRVALLQRSIILDIKAAQLSHVDAKSSLM